MQIKNLTLESPFILAPLAGYTDLPFRLICREYGAALCYSEMISCHGLVYQQKNTLRLLESMPEERPVSMQLFGSDPSVMGDAAAILTQYPIDLIDINMGCPVKKVVRKGAGAALMKDPDRAARIIKAVCDAVSVPVTVKIRSGWDHRSINAPDFAAMAEDFGASAVAVHGRTWRDGFGGTVDKDVIREVKKRISIPVIGNGDLHSHADGIRMMAETGCDAVMIGRAALGAPWIFKDSPADPPLSSRLKALARHLHFIRQYQQPDQMLGRIKNHAGRYAKGSPVATALRREIHAAPSFNALAELVDNALAVC